MGLMYMTDEGARKMYIMKVERKGKGREGNATVQSLLGPEIFLY